jgi:predicted permease
MATVQAVTGFLRTLMTMFVIVVCGFLGVRWELLPAPLMGGLGRVLGNFALPALLFRTTVS